MGCKKLASVNLPNTVTKLKDSVFGDCFSLTSITLPKSLSSISVWAFNDSGLKYINVESGNQVYDSREGCNAVIETATNTLVVGSANTIIPSSVKKIGRRAFAGNPNLTTITLPEGLEEIGAAAFSGCANLTSITIPTTIINLGNGVFAGTGLTQAVIPTNIKQIPRETFAACEELTKVTLHDDITGIGDYAFMNCPKLSDINLPKGLTAISQDAFCRCESLTSLDLSEMKNLEFLGSGAFAYSGLTSVKIPASINQFDRYGGRFFESCPVEYLETDNELLCSKSMFGTGESNKSNLKELVIGNSVKSIPEYAFEGCTDLTTITLSENLDSIGASAFRDCNKIAGPLVIPTNVVFVGNNAFENCSSITSLTLPANLKCIATSAFKNCNNIASLTLPSMLETVLDSAFYACGKLPEIIIPDNCTYIGELAFIDCTQAKTIKLPSNANLYIAKRAFFNNWNTTEIYSNNVTPPYINEVTFMPEDKSNCTVYVPKGSASAYTIADGWKDFNIVELDNTACEAPEIKISGGKIQIDSKTPNVKYHYTIKANEFEGESTDGKDLEVKFIISAYVSAQGQENSPVVTREFTLDELQNDGPQGDINGDNIVDVSDVTKLINLILKK